MAMMPSPLDGVSYGVQVLEGDGTWRTRWGWFPLAPKMGDSPGLIRAQDNMKYAVDTEGYRPSHLRIVKATLDIEVVEGIELSADIRPHSRACGYLAHPHGFRCSKNCPTCHGEPS